MLTHSCYCIFISVTGGFVQMLKDFKNLLKMSLKILFIKRKRKFPSISSPSSRSARWPLFFFPRGPAPAPARLASPFSRPAQLRAAQQPRQPRPAQQLRLHPHQATAGPAPRACFPRPAADSPTPPVSASPTSTRALETARPCREAATAALASLERAPSRASASF